MYEKSTIVSILEQNL